MNAMRMLAAGSAMAAATLCATAFGQTTAKIQIADGAAYDQALKCYQYYDVAEQVANARAAKAAAGSDSQKELQARAGVDKALKAAWNRHIDATKDKKSNKVVDDDLARIGAPIIADANAGLAGDKGASDRYEAIQKACKIFETVEQAG